jgi:signal transduction histidine kinase
MAGAIFIPSTFFHFSLALIGQRNKYLKAIFFWYLISLIFLIFDFTSLFVQDVRPRLFFPHWPTAGITYTPFLAFFIGLTIYAHVLMYKAYKRLTGFKRNQIKYVFLGTAIGFLGGSTNYPLWYGIPVPPLGNILVAVYVFLVAYSIIKYRLMDINVALTRAGVFIMVYLLVLGVPLGLMGWGKNWLQKLFGEAWYWAPVILASILATAGPFIYQSLRRRAEDVILKDQRRYQKALRELSKAMARIRDLDQLLKAITSTIINNVKVGFAAIYVKDDEYKSYKLSSCSPQTEKSRFQEFIPLDYSLVNRLNSEKSPLMSEEIGSQDKIDLNSGIVIPCFIEDNLLAFIALGAKPNSQMYTPDDVLIFETLSYSTSLAIENSIFWKEIEDRQRQARLREMDTYSYSLAHEIDNPMQVILGHATLLKAAIGRTNLSEAERKELEESLDFILECRQRVSTMVEAIRDFGQKATGEHMPLNIEEVVESFAQLYSPQFKANSVVFEKSSQLKEPVFVLGEKPELMQVLVILANNAVHAMTGLKEKKVSLNIELAHHGWVRISFSDNGYGINSENLKIIFKPFVTSKASTEGTGMGLHNALRIVERHKGKIWAESAGQGKGATFFIEFPIAKDVKPEDLEDKQKSRRLF